MDIQLGLGLARNGYRVFGTALSPEEVEDLRSASDGEAQLTVCDITRETVVAADITGSGHESLVAFATECRNFPWVHSSLGVRELFRRQPCLRAS